LKNQEARFADSFGKKKLVRNSSITPNCQEQYSPDLEMSKQVKVSVGPRNRRVLAKTYPPSSFCSLARGLAEEAATGGIVPGGVADTASAPQGLCNATKTQG
jgi:hypothetical protein